MGPYQFEIYYYRITTDQEHRRTLSKISGGDL